MTDDFKFDAKKHAYFLNGKPMLGCTSVLGVIAKPALVPWAAKMATEYISANCDFVKEDVAEGNDGYFKVREADLSEAKSAHRKKKEDAADKGTDLHALVEEYVKWCIELGGNAQMPIVAHYVERWAPLQFFIEWAQKQEIRFIATEQRLYSKSLWVAGTCDLIFEKGGKRFVGDIKTYKKIWDRVPLIQCAGYALMLEEMSGFHMDVETRVPNEAIDGYCVICLPKERSFNEAEDVLWSFDPQTDREAFISAVKLYKYLNQ
jgi:hypothetical protein